MRPLISRRAAIVAAWAVLAGACLQSTEGTTGDTNRENATVLVTLIPTAGTDALQPVRFLRASVEATDEPVIGDIVPFESTTIELEIPFGEGRQIVVEGFGASTDTAVGRGVSLPMDFDREAGPFAVDVLFSRVGELDPLTSVPAGAAQTLSQGRFLPAVAVTDREVIIAGGRTDAPADAWWAPGNGDGYLSSVEIVDLADMSVRTLPEGMFFRRVWHTATAASDGNVFLAGGYAAGDDPGQLPNVLKRVEVVFASDDVNSKVAVLQFALRHRRAAHSATLIDSELNTILLVGGDDGSGGGTWELWNPSQGSVASGPLPGGMDLRFHQATLVHAGRPDARVYVTGGQTGNKASDAILVFDVAARTMRLHDSHLTVPRVHHTATYVPGREYVYVVGGFTDAARSDTTDAIDVIDVANDTVLQSAGFQLTSARGAQAASAVRGHGVFLAGGLDSTGAPLASLDIVFEADLPSGQSVVIDVAGSGETLGLGTVPALPAGRFGHAVVTLPTWHALVVGGATGDGSLPTALTLYTPR